METIKFRFAGTWGFFPDNFLADILTQGEQIIPTNKVYPISRPCLESFRRTWIYIYYTKPKIAWSRLHGKLTENLDLHKKFQKYSIQSIHHTQFSSVWLCTIPVVHKSCILLSRNSLQVFYFYFFCAAFDLWFTIKIETT